MGVLLTGFIALTVVMILSGTLVPRRELDAVVAVRELRPSAPRPVVDYDLAYGIRAQAEIVELLPHWMRADFDCPDRGPHHWLSTHRGPVQYEFCAHCRRRRLISCPDTRDPLEVVLSLQRSR